MTGVNMKRLRTEVEIETFDLTNEEEFKVEQARLKIEKVINSAAFRYFVLGFSWERITTTGHLWWKKYHKETDDFSLIKMYLAFFNRNNFLTIFIYTVK